MHQQCFCPKAYISYRKKYQFIPILSKMTIKHMLVWHNKCCSGISPKSCSNPSLHSWGQSCSDVLPGAQRGGHAGLVSLRALQALLAGAISPGDRWGDQSLARWRISIAEGLSVCLRDFTPLSPSLCLSASTLVHVGVSAGSSLMRRKKVRSFLRPWMRDRLKCPR